MEMKSLRISLVLLLSVNSLWSASYEEMMKQAEELFKAKKYANAAAVFDDASLETDDTQKRIEARYRNWNSLRKARAKNTVSVAESLLYDETELDFERKIELISYIALYGSKAKSQKVLEFGLNLKGLDEKQRSRVLLVALKTRGSWQSGAYVKEILSMKDPDPAAKASALGDLANVYLWTKRDPVNALRYISEALAIKELKGQDRQFYLLVQARCYAAVKRFDMAELSYLAAIRIAQQHNFQEAAYKELTRVYLLSKQGEKIEPLLKLASVDKCLNKRQRQVFLNLLVEINKAQKQ